MGLFSRRAARPSQMASDDESKWRRIKLALSSGAGWGGIFGLESAAGKMVTRDAALQLSTAFACMRMQSEAVPIMPLKFYRATAAGEREEIDDYPLALLFSESPNIDQTPTEYLQGKTAWLAAQGNAYSLKSEGAGGRIVALDPLHNDDVRPLRNADGELVYRLSDRGKTELVPRNKIFHVRGWGFGGDLGLSPIACGVQTLGSALATEETAARIFANGLQVGGVLSSDSRLNKDQRTDLQKIMEKYVGSTSAGKLMILEAGLKYQQLTLNPEDAQMLETRRFSVEEICRWFGVPPLLVYHAAQGQTMWGTGIEQILLAWLVLGLNPMLKRFEQRIRKDLIPPADRHRVHCEFNREALLQMDSATKMSFLASMTQNGLMDRNEGRAKLNLPKRAGADVLTAQTNLAPLDRLGAGDATGANAARAALRAFLGFEEEAKP